MLSEPAGSPFQAELMLLGYIPVTLLLVYDVCVANKFD